MKTLGARIRRARNEAKLTQEKLAEASNLGVRSLQKIEAGQINILVTTLRRIRKALQCDWEDLLDD